MVIWNHLLLQTCMTSDTPKGHTICGMQNSRNPHMLIGVSWDSRSFFHITSPEFLGCSGWWGCQISVNVKPRGFKVSPGSHRSTPRCLCPATCHTMLQSGPTSSGPLPAGECEMWSPRSVPILALFPSPPSLPSSLDLSEIFSSLSSILIFSNTYPQRFFLSNKGLHLEIVWLAFV